MIDHDDCGISVRRQCGLLGIPRSSAYYEPASESEENLLIMKHIDQQYLKTPFYGSRRMVLALENLGFEANRKRVQRLMQIMGLEAIYPKKRTSDPAKGHKKYPYLLRDLSITSPDQVWCTDITYIPLRSGFMYLAGQSHVRRWKNVRQVVRSGSYPRHIAYADHEYYL